MQKNNKVYELGDKIMKYIIDSQKRKEKRNTKQIFYLLNDEIETQYISSEIDFFNLFDHFSKFKDIEMSNIFYLQFFSQFLFYKKEYKKLEAAGKIEDGRIISVIGDKDISCIFSREEPIQYKTSFNYPDNDQSVVSQRNIISITTQPMYKKFDINEEEKIQLLVCQYKKDKWIIQTIKNPDIFVEINTEKALLFAFI